MTRNYLCFALVAILAILTFSTTIQSNHIYVSNSRIDSNAVINSLSSDSLHNDDLKQNNEGFSFRNSNSHNFQATSASGRPRQTRLDRLHAYPQHNHVATLHAPLNPTQTRSVTLSIPSTLKSTKPRDIENDIGSEIRQWLIQFRKPLVKEDKLIVNNVLYPYQLGEYIPDNTYKVFASVDVINKILPNHLRSGDSILGLDQHEGVDNLHNIEKVQNLILLITEFHPVFKISQNLKPLHSTHTNIHRDVTPYNPMTSDDVMSLFGDDDTSTPEHKLKRGHETFSTFATGSLKPLVRPAHPDTHPVRDNRQDEFNLDTLLTGENNDDDMKKSDEIDSISLIVHIINPSQTHSEAQEISHELLTSLATKWKQQQKQLKQNKQIIDNKIKKPQQDDTTSHTNNNDILNSDKSHIINQHGPEDFGELLPDTAPTEYISISIGNKENTMLHITSHYLTTDNRDYSKLQSRTWLVTKIFADYPLVDFIEQRTTHQSQNRHANSIIQSDVYPLLNTFDVLEMTTSLRNDPNAKPDQFSPLPNDIHTALHNQYSSTPLWDHGLTGHGQIVAVADTGVDHDGCFFYDPKTPIPFNRFDRTHRKIVAYHTSEQIKPRDLVGGDQVDGHGTHTSATMVGEPPQSADPALQVHRGLVFGAKLAVFDYQHPTAKSDEMVLPDDVYNDYLHRAMHEYGVSVTSNSWGDIQGLYDSFSRSIDRFMFNNPSFINVFACGNTGLLGKHTIASPALSKNVIAVGSVANAPKSWYDRGYSAGVKITEIPSSTSSRTRLTVGNYIAVKPAEFGAKFTKIKNNTKMLLLRANPEGACTKLNNTPRSTILDDIQKQFGSNTDWEIAIITRRGQCSFAQKAQQIQLYGAKVMVVVNNDVEGDGMDIMNVSPNSSVPKTAYADLASVMVPYSLGEGLMDITPMMFTSITSNNNFIVEAPVPYVESDQHEYRLSSFSSRGPTKDGRIKPDIVAPGEYIVSARSDGDLKSHQCNANDGSTLKPMQGTSMSAPVIASAAVLVREYIMKGFYPFGIEKHPLGPFDFIKEELWPEAPSLSFENTIISPSAAPTNNNNNNNRNNNNNSGNNHIGSSILSFIGSLFGETNNDNNNNNNNNNNANANNNNNNASTSAKKRFSTSPEGIQYSWLPSASLVKALLVHSAIAIGGNVETELPNEVTLYEKVTPPPSIYQGFGRVKLDNVLYLNDTIEATIRQRNREMFPDKPIIDDKPSVFMIDYTENGVDGFSAKDENYQFEPNNQSNLFSSNSQHKNEVRERWYGGPSSFAIVDATDTLTYCFDMNSLFDSIAQYSPQPTPSATESSADFHPFRKWAQDNEIITPILHTFSYAYSAFADPNIKVSLVWTDPPASLSASKILVNDLDLTVDLIGAHKNIQRGGNDLGKDVSPGDLWRVQTTFIGNEHADNGGNLWGNLDMFDQKLDSDIMKTIAIDGIYQDESGNDKTDKTDKTVDKTKHVASFKSQYSNLPQFFNQTAYPEDYTINPMSKLEGRSYDSLNNIEQVFISSTDINSILYTIASDLTNSLKNNANKKFSPSDLLNWSLSVNVHGRSIPQGPQPFSLVVSTLFGGVIHEKRLLPSQCFIAQNQQPQQQSKQLDPPKVITSRRKSGKLLIQKETISTSPNTATTTTNTAISTPTNNFNCINGCSDKGICINSFNNPFDSKQGIVKQFLSTQTIPKRLSHPTPQSPLYNNYINTIVMKDGNDVVNGSVELSPNRAVFGCFCSGDAAGPDCSYTSRPIPLHSTHGSTTAIQFDVADVFNQQPNDMQQLSLLPTQQSFHHIYFPSIEQRPQANQITAKDGIYITTVRRFHQGDTDIYALLPPAPPTNSNNNNPDSFYNNPDEAQKPGMYFVSPLSLAEYTFANGGYPSPSFHTIKSSLSDSIFDEMITITFDDAMIPYNPNNPAILPSVLRRQQRGGNSQKVRVTQQMFIPWYLLAYHQPEGYIKLNLQAMCCDPTDISIIAHYSFTHPNNNVQYVFPYRNYPTLSTTKLSTLLSQQSHLHSYYSKLPQHFISIGSQGDSNGPIYTSVNSLLNNIIDTSKLNSNSLIQYRQIVPQINANGVPMAISNNGLLNRPRITQNDIKSLQANIASGNFTALQSYIDSTLPASLRLTPLPYSNAGPTRGLHSFILEKEVKSFQYITTTPTSTENTNPNLNSILQQYFRLQSTAIKTRLTLTTNISKLPDNFNELIAHEISVVLGVDQQPCRIQILAVNRIDVPITTTNTPTSATGINHNSEIKVVGSAAENYVKVMSAGGNSNNNNNNNNNIIEFEKPKPHTATTFQSSSGTTDLKTVLSIDFLILPPLSIDALFQTTSHINTFETSSVETYRDLMQLQTYLIGLHKTCNNKVATMVPGSPSQFFNGPMGQRGVGAGNILDTQQLYVQLLQAFGMGLPASTFSVFNAHDDDKTVHDDIRTNPSSSHHDHNNTTPSNRNTVNTFALPSVLPMSTLVLSYVDATLLPPLEYVSVQLCSLGDYKQSCTVQRGNGVFSVPSTLINPFITIATNIRTSMTSSTTTSSTSTTQGRRFTPFQMHVGEPAALTDDHLENNTHRISNHGNVDADAIERITLPENRFLVRTPNNNNNLLDTTTTNVESTATPTFDSSNQTPLTSSVPNVESTSPTSSTSNHLTKNPVFGDMHLDQIILLTLFVMIILVTIGVSVHTCYEKWKKARHYEQFKSFMEEDDDEIDVGINFDDYSTEFLQNQNNQRSSSSTIIPNITTQYVTPKQQKSIQTDVNKVNTLSVNNDNNDNNGNTISTPINTNHIVNVNSHYSTNNNHTIHSIKDNSVALRDNTDLNHNDNNPNNDFNDVSSVDLNNDIIDEFDRDFQELTGGLVDEVNINSTQHDNNTNNTNNNTSNNINNANNDSDASFHEIVILSP